jgi:hypothetical protein
MGALSRLGFVAAVAAVGALGALAGCASGDDEPPFRRDDGGPGVDVDGSQPGSKDSDQDGLCDATEAGLGSDPDTGDSDDDGLPDFVEVIYGFLPTNPTSPEQDQIARLTAVPGTQTSWPIRLSATGEPNDFIGVFENVPAPYDDGSSAGTFFVSSSAVACEPPDAVRGIEAERQRFVLALGPVRLELGVELKYDGLVDTTACTRAYPFQYFIKDDDGAVVADRFYLLVVAEPGEEGAEHFCKPASCF